jgi:hypothetical protein
MKGTNMAVCKSWLLTMGELPKENLVAGGRNGSFSHG